MSQAMKTFFFAIFLVSTFSPVFASEGDILGDLRSIPGLEVKETTSDEDSRIGYQRFSITIEQPVDHFDKSSPKFRQKLVLMHKGYDQPMVLQTSGYQIFGEYPSALTLAFGANQIQVEHRFFGDSVPQNKDWNKLTVRQSAEDFHRVVQTFKTKYPKSWVNTGGSKGGMTSIYHRRFYPEDLQGTVADVAPLSFTREDPRYVTFLDEVGGEKHSGCRAKLETLQVELLRRKQELLPRISGSFELLGGKETAFEHAIIELPFAFWQYGSPSSCGSIPATGATADQFYNALVRINNPGDLGDGRISAFQPYFFQAAAELGSGASKLSHLQGLITKPYNLEMYLPRGVEPSYTDQTMIDMRDWVKRSAKGVMFVYGEFDPWTAGAFRDPAPGSDNHWFLSPAANHGANFTRLPSEEYRKAIDVLSRWMGKSPRVGTQDFLSKQTTLEDIELAARRGMKGL